MLNCLDLPGSPRTVMKHSDAVLSHIRVCWHLLGRLGTPCEISIVGGVHVLAAFQELAFKVSEVIDAAGRADIYLKGNSEYTLTLFAMAALAGRTCSKLLLYR
jgi:hypothetical protein